MLGRGRGYQRYAIVVMQNRKKRAVILVNYLIKNIMKLIYGNIPMLILLIFSFLSFKEDWQVIGWISFVIGISSGVIIKTND